ncbi:hypothetical protein BAE44_0012915, partial [Dichanthelium oligosanthes]
LGSFDCCSGSNNGDSGDESCQSCIRNGTSLVLLHGMSQAKTLALAAGVEMVCLHLKPSCSCSSCFKHHVYSKDLFIYAGRFGMVAPGMKSIWCSMHRIGGNHAGTSLGKRPTNFCRTNCTLLGSELIGLLVFEKGSL